MTHYDPISPYHEGYHLVLLPYEIQIEVMTALNGERDTIRVIVCILFLQSQTKRATHLIDPSYKHKWRSQVTCKGSQI